MTPRSLILPGLTAVTAAVFLFTSAHSADPVKPADPPVAAKTDIPALPGEAVPTPADVKAKQEANAKLFKDFKEKLFQLQSRLEKSERPEAKEQAKVIKSALELAEKQGVDGQFARLMLDLARDGKNLKDYENLMAEEKTLSKMLQEILALLMTDDESAKLKEMIKALEAYKKELEAIKRQQMNHQARTDSGKGDKGKLAGEQKDLADRTKDIADRMNGKKAGDGNPGEKKDDTAEPKGDPKSGESAGEAKEETGEAKGGEKDGKGEPKDGPPSEGKGSGKGEPKDAGESKGSGKGEPKDAGDAKGGEPKGGEPKAGDPPAGESKGGSKSQGEGKGNSKSEGKGQAGDSKGSGQPSQGGGQSPPSGSKGSGQPSGGGGQQPPQQPQSETPGRKEVQEAVPYQQDASQQIEKDKRPDASKLEDKAIQKLDEAIKELEKKLKQLREEELRKLLANIEARCGKMLMMQIEVYEQTKAIDGSITKNGGQKQTADIQKAQQQSDKEGEIVAEADRALKLLESEGSAVAFAKVLEEVRQDMIAVQRRLSVTVVDRDTQEIETAIIGMLKDMMEALKKAQKELGKKDGGGGGGGGKPGNQKLIDLLAELKLIRNMQMQVNTRTKMYGEKEKAEQSKDPLVQVELKQLSARQAKLQEMIDKIASGENQ